MDKTGHMTIAAHTAGRRNGRQWMRRFLLAAVLLFSSRCSGWNLSGGAGGGHGFFAQKSAAVP